ncbi:MAG: hypothetical protein CO186_08170 [Zetaproteobacteria bacterium CG_4_9_14_3_um_filter_49_83]|nr:MAG: hypothetical protein COW62_03170 [Zetaproteobacteria bacterium CG17_big_fil_post_rev_8_21_14_2_50_50_13]PIV29139.1 MAG: hypothetical protein COS35_13630 [Zetaproteobacteria bacterium CG02_land_8_20_14_3_00_50_9]PIY55893.1 MAG: hypothetical protein COZ00_07170 [Zetaproteobacteria bacterium CG_4_10_14_0_8_um_filter_49_80]PJA35023.1 MAG: hypothetical protein CO186_08170 [Zetaproteobacteria bacterium CG_4_9_14_3_um_filter_49_83]
MICPASEAAGARASCINPGACPKIEASTVDIENRVRYALLDIYTGQQPVLLSGYLLFVFVIAYMTRDVAELRSALLIWCGLNLAIVADVLRLVWLFKKNKHRFTAPAWVRVLIPRTLVFGLLWGVGPLLFMDVSSTHHMVTFSVLILGVLSASAYFLSIIPPLFHLFFVPSLMLYGSIVYVQGMYIVAAATMLFLFFLTWMAHKIHHMMYEVYVARFQNERLAQSLREEKERAEKANRAKTSFLAAASHDLRQPLQAQRLFAEAIHARTQEAELSELGEQILASQHAMQLMLDGLLDISRLDAGTVTPELHAVSLHGLFSSLSGDFSLLAEGKGLQFHMHWPPKETAIHSDPGLLESILRNLLNNALRYTRRGAIMLAARKRGQYWRIEVRDSGIGVPVVYQQEIFEEFRQLGNPERDRTKGLGLGLSIVQRLCRLLDYPLTLYSRPNRGSVFAIEVPALTRAIGLIDEVVTDLDLTMLQGLFVLVIDDEQSIRQGLQASLQGYGIRVQAAANRREACAIVESAIPDIIITDYRLPENDNGVAVVESLCVMSKRHIPAILLTGDTSPERLQALQTTPWPMLHKPASINTLLHAIQDVFQPG